MENVRMLLVSVLVFVVFVFVGCDNKVQSKTENATAPVVEEAGPTAPAEDVAPAATEAPAAPTAVSSANAISIANVFAKKAELNNKEVTVAGKVAKISMGILGSNWIHIQDGTGSKGSDDITVTTQAQPKVGDKVVATGILATDKDFGAGYKYNVIIEKANVTVQ